MEIWKTLVYKGIEFLRLEISNYGAIRNKKTNKILKQSISKKGYCSVVTSNGESKPIYIRIHCAVAENFIPNPNNLPQVNHKDGNKLNNAYTNLEWITNRDNILHASKSGFYDPHRNKKSKPVMSLEDGREYISIGKAGEAYATEATSAATARKNISRALRCKGCAYGMTWIYIDDVRGESV